MPDAAAGTPPLGANIVDGGAEFRVWSPASRGMDLELDGARRVAMERDERGVWAARVAGIGAGARYLFRIDDRWSYADPYSRSQPDGPYGPSQVMDLSRFTWHDGHWRGLTSQGLVIYEMHVGTLTPAGTFDAAIGELDRLVALGVTAVELMPICEFPGDRNWGYDVADLFAPSHVYGGPDGMHRFVDAAHARRIGVILDVVYNHFSPDGSYLLEFAGEYLTDRHETPWGQAVNFDGVESSMVRRFFVDNATHWVSEYHVDGIRIDAAFTIRDDSPRHILTEIAAAARAAAAGRSIVMIAETYENDVRYVRSEAQGGRGFDAVWADDFHHVVHARAIHERGGYYADYEGTLAELARTINRGWLFEGQQSRFFGAARGTSADDMSAAAFVYCLQNHDQVANRAFGQRLSASLQADEYRVWSSVLLLLPYTPMVFMGQEYAASTPFAYFTDHHGELGERVTEGRFSEFAHHEDEEERRRRFPDPQAESMFLESKLNARERSGARGRATEALYAALLNLRREDRVLSRQDRTQMLAVAVSDDVLAVRMWHGSEERLLVANLGEAMDLHLRDLSVPPRRTWSTVISTDEPAFGGDGRPAAIGDDVLVMPRMTAAWFAADG